MFPSYLTQTSAESHIQTIMAYSGCGNTKLDDLSTPVRVFGIRYQRRVFIVGTRG